MYNSPSDDIITYDDCGGMTFDGSREYGYDISGRISMIGDTEYKYDALGRLAINTSGSVSVYYYYDAAGRIIAEYSTDDDGQTLDFERSFIWGSRFNEIIAMDDGVSLKYMFTDALGSVTAVYDAATSTAEFTTYDAYGNSETAPASPYGYAGMRVAMFTDNCSLYITPNRAYSPKLGRWLQPDPLGTTPNPQTGNVYSPLKQYSDGLNLYAYTENNPINKTDDWGLWGNKKKTKCQYNSFAITGYWHIPCYSSAEEIAVVQSVAEMGGIPFVRSWIDLGLFIGTGPLYPGLVEATLTHVSNQCGSKLYVSVCYWECIDGESEFVYCDIKQCQGDCMRYSPRQHSTRDKCISGFANEAFGLGFKFHIW